MVHRRCSRPKLQSSLDLAAATVVARRRSRGLVQVLLRTKVEFLFALGTAEVIGLPFMLGSSSGSSAFYDRIFHSCCAIHYDLPRLRIEGSNRRADRLSKSAHSGPTNRLYPQRLTNTCAPHDCVRFPAREFK